MYKNCMNFSIQSYQIKFTIYLMNLKNVLQSIKNQDQIVKYILFENKQTKRNNQSRNETIFAQLL